MTQLLSITVTVEIPDGVKPEITVGKQREHINMDELPKLAKRGGYTEEEEQFIIDNYGKLSNKDIAKKLGRSESAIGVKIYWLKRRGVIEDKKHRNKRAATAFVCIQDCASCEHGEKEEFGDFYWCTMKGQRVNPDGTLVIP